jgi:hypothetical protein
MLVNCNLFYLQMASSKQSERGTPIYDQLNTTSLSVNGINLLKCTISYNAITCAFYLGGVDVGGSVTSNDIPPPLEPRQRRRQRDRNRYMLMSVQKKEELLKKRRQN